jgi:putative nucleotidyltransferase with HDIG domain
MIPFFEVIFSLTLLTVLMVNGKQHAARRPFVIFLFFMTLWGFLLFMVRANIEGNAALVWGKFVFWAMLSASLFFFRFTLVLTGVKVSSYFLYSIYAVYFATMILIPTGLIISGTRVISFITAPVIGPLFSLFVLGVAVPIVSSGIILIKYHQSTRSIDNRLRAQYIIAGTGLMIVGIIADYLIAMGIDMYPLAAITNSLFCLVATIAMLRHNLLDMQVVFRKGLTYSLTTALLFCIFGSVIFLSSYLSRGFMNPFSLVMTFLTVFIAALLFQPVLTQFQHKVDKWFFRDRYEHIRTLKQFANSSRHDLNLKSLSSAFVETVANSLQSCEVSLLLPVPVSGNFITYTSAGQKHKNKVSFPASSQIVTGMAHQTGVVDCNNLKDFPFFKELPPRERKALDGNGIELILPLQSNNRLAGMLLVGRKINSGTYSSEEQNILQAVSGEIADSIDNANNFENMQRKHHELQRVMDGVIHAVSLLVGSRDPYTANHQRRVAELARAIAKEIGLTEWQTMGIFIAGLLHDVGKVAVPLDILSKPGRITTSEYDIIKCHCRVGHDILQRIDFPWPVTQAVLQHHERLDGSGYPGGLVGDDIILEARILGVADVVEAMSSHRPYRPALGLNFALNQLKSERGSHFDTVITDACLKLLTKNGPEFERIMEAADVSRELVVFPAKV